MTVGSHNEVRVAKFMEMSWKDSNALRGALCQVFCSSFWCWLARPCIAQGVEDSAAPDAPDGQGSVLVPGGFVGVVAPVHDRIALNLYDFYYAEVKAPVAQVDVPLRATTFLTITPSYLYYEVPPSGLNAATEAGTRIYRHVRGEPISNRRGR